MGAKAARDHLPGVVGRERLSLSALRQELGAASERVEGVVATAVRVANASDEAAVVCVGAR